MDRTQQDKEIVAAWEELSNNVLGVILSDPGAYFAVADEIGGNSGWFPPGDRAIWNAVVEAAVNGPPTPEQVVLKTGGVVGLDRLTMLAVSVDLNASAMLPHNTRAMKEVGQLAAMRQIGQRLSKVSDPAQVLEEIGNADRELSRIAAVRKSRSSDAKTLSEDAFKFSGRLVKTGMQWYDDLTGGLWTGKNHWIVAAYKSGKTTIARNWALHALRNSVGVSFFTAEEGREALTLDFITMIAADSILKAQTGRKMQTGLSSTKVIRSYLEPENVQLTSVEQEAIAYGREVWDGLNVRVYDQLDGITDLITLRHLIRSDKMNHGIDAAFFDYSQLFGSGQTIFERQSTTSLFFQAIAQTEDIAVVVLAQKSEEGVRQKNDYSPHVKGGGDAPAAADFMVIPSIDEDMYGVITVKLHLARRTPKGEFTHTIDVNSGLLADAYFQMVRRELDDDWGSDEYATDINY
jgi:hypothetical protein